MSFSLTGTHNLIQFSHFGETVTWRPFGGPDRSIKVVVDRNPPQPLGDVGQSHSAGMVVVVRNSQTEIADDTVGGIALSELSDGGLTRGRITMPNRVGGDSSDRVIRRILEQDEGCLTLEVS